jgi:hypothetical protein
MFSWLQLALTLLKLGNNIILWFQQRQLIAAGYDQAIAEQGQRTLAMTTRGKALLEKINALDEKDVDAELRGLEPPAR